MVDPDLFRSVLGRFASSVTVLSARDAEGVDHGMTVSAFASVSLTPPLVLACVDRSASIHPVLQSARNIGISILSAEQESLSRRFAQQDTDRFDDLDIRRGANGVALISGALAHLECSIVSRHTGGDHVIYVCAVDDAEGFSGQPLLYFLGGYARLES